MSVSRRRFLLGSAGALAMFPFLRSPSAHAAGAQRKLLLLFTPHGTVWPSWRPTGAETSFTLSPILAPLGAHQTRLSIIDGLSLPYGTSYYVPHTYTMPSLWTGSPIDTNTTTFCRSDHGVCFGWGTGTSIDQAIAARLPSGETPYRSIELGYGCSSLHPRSRMIYGAARTPKSPIDDPVRAFDTLFGSLTTDPSAAAAQARRVRKQSVFDTAHADLSARRATLSANDRAKLDAHATAIREIERRLQTQGAACTKPAAPTSITAENALDRQSDIVAAALGCGLTRIASLQFHVADSDEQPYPWVGLQSSFHSMSHDSSANAQASLAKVYTWFAGRLNYLLDRLQATPDPAGGSVLDNTLVIWGTELGRGYDHDISNVPFVLAGGANVVQGGRYKRVTGTNHRVLVTAAHAMGMTDIDKYGTLDNGSGPLPGVLV